MSERRSPSRKDRIKDPKSNIKKIDSDDGSCAGAGAVAVPRSDENRLACLTRESAESSRNAEDSSRSPPSPTTEHAVVRELEREREREVFEQRKKLSSVNLSLFLFFTGSLFVARTFLNQRSELLALRSEYAYMRRLNAGSKHKTYKSDVEYLMSEIKEQETEVLQANVNAKHAEGRLKDARTKSNSDAYDSDIKYLLSEIIEQETDMVQTKVDRKERNKQLQDAKSLLDLALVTIQELKNRQQDTGDAITLSYSDWNEFERRVAAFNAQIKNLEEKSVVVGRRTDQVENLKKDNAILQNKYHELRQRYKAENDAFVRKLHSLTNENTDLKRENVQSESRQSARYSRAIQKFRITQLFLHLNYMEMKECKENEEGVDDELTFLYSQLELAVDRSKKMKDELQRSDTARNALLSKHNDMERASTKMMIAQQLSLFLLKDCLARVRVDE